MSPTSTNRLRPAIHFRSLTAPDYLSVYTSRASAVFRAQHHERWAGKDPYAAWPLYRDPALYAKKTIDKKRTKDPWAAYWLV
jgi:hypothetical protein